jgi:hypothetical protein
MRVRSRMLHRVAAKVIEARRLQCPIAAFVVQPFAKADNGKTDAKLTYCEALCRAVVPYHCIAWPQWDAAISA